jgi:hypothetical protein
MNLSLMRRRNAKALSFCFAVPRIAVSARLRTAHRTDGSPVKNIALGQVVPAPVLQARLLYNVLYGRWQRQINRGFISTIGLSYNPIDRQGFLFKSIDILMSPPA